MPVLAAAFLQFVLTDLLAPFLDQTSHDAFLWTQRLGRSRIIDSLPVTLCGDSIRRSSPREKNPASLCRNGPGGKQNRLGILNAARQRENGIISPSDREPAKERVTKRVTGKAPNTRRDESREGSQALVPKRRAAR